MAPPRALGTLIRAFATRPWCRRLVGTESLREVRRELDVGSNDADQHSVIFGATLIGFKSLYQGQGLFRAQWLSEKQLLKNKELRLK